MRPNYKNLEIDLNKFKVKRKLGRGRNAEVFLVENVDDGRQYALKKINHGEDDQKREEILHKLINREISIMARFSHPAIVQFEGFEYYPHHFAITKHYPNGSLQHTLKEKPAFWDGTMKSKCVYGLVAAVTHIHNTYDETEEDFSIRYLCPENIIFDDQNEPRLINYVFKDEVLGKTPNAYIPPELHENPEGSRYDEDVWALGMILYEILTGHKPYNDLENEEKVKEAVVSGTLPKFPPPSPETDNIIGIIQNCLDKVPTNRPLPYMILHHLSNLSEDLFPGTDKESYNSYRNRVQEATLNSDESYAYISKVITDEVDNEDLLAKIKAGDTQAMIRL